MSTVPTQPWTFEPFEMYRDKTWEILDPNMATRVAIFFDKKEAEAYLAWKNKKQAKKWAKQEAKRSKAAAARISSGPSHKWSWNSSSS